MQREDWTPAVLVTALMSLVTATAVWLLTMQPFGADEPTAGQPRRQPPAEVVVWTGELVPGLTGVLGPIWGDPGPDQEHDRELNEGLGLLETAPPRWYRLLLFNQGGEVRELALADGALTLDAPQGHASAPLRSVSQMVAAGTIAPNAGLAFTLRSQGTLKERVELPPRTSAQLVLAFGGGVRLEDAVSVSTAQGLHLTRRPMGRLQYRQLLEGADEDTLRDL